MRKLLFQSLVRRPVTEPALPVGEVDLETLALELDAVAKRRLGRSLFASSPRRAMPTSCW
jgi:hypothetical protein